MCSGSQPGAGERPRQGDQVKQHKSAVPAPRHLAVFTTGGTIDKVYFDAKGGYPVGAPVVRALLKHARVSPRPRVVELMRKDSLEMDLLDRRAVRRAVAQSLAQAVVVTHGTDTLADTARSLLGIRGKTIVLTGALQPGRFAGSDAAFNVGMAIGAALSLPPGVYVTANGRLYAAGSVRKNRARNRFESVPRIDRSRP